MGELNPPQDPWEKWGWLMAAVWLVFLVFPVSALVTSPASPAVLVLGWMGVILFTASYVAGFTVSFRAHTLGPPGRTVILMYFAQIACIGLTIPAIGSEATALLPFLMSYAAYGIHGRWHWVTTGASMVIVVVVLFIEGPQDGALSIFFVVLLLAVVNTISTQLIVRGADADQLKIELVTSRERETIARDVHDLVGHTLTVIKLKSELAVRLIDRDPERAKAEIEEIASLTGEAISGVRSTVTGLKASTLAEQLGVSGEALRSAGVAVEVEGSAEALSPAQSITASWIVREATTNILRHADARTVRIALGAGTVLVEDDGRGIDGDAGNGLRGMAERAAISGARLAVEPSPSGGTRVEVTW
ncbi:MAG: sensor histidine kinase [Microbacterium sp.]